MRLLIIESNTTEKNDKLFIFIIAVCSLLYFCGGIGKWIGDNLLGFTNSYILFFYAITQKRIKLKYNVVLPFWGLLSVTISFVIIGGGWGSYLTNIGVLLLLILFSNCRFTRPEISLYLKYLYASFAFTLLYTFVFRFNDGYIGAFNSNTIAYHSLICLIFLVNYPIKNKILFYFFLISGVFLIIYSTSRTNLGALLLFGILFFFRKVICRPKVLKYIFFALAISGILFTYFYAILLGDSEYFEVLSDYNRAASEKQLFTGREVIWSLAWKKLMTAPLNFLLGIGSHFYKGVNNDLYSNFHGSYITVLICIGMIGFLIFVFASYKFYGKYLRIKVPPEMLLANLSYLPIMFVGLFESNLFSGHFAIVTYLLICFSNSNISEYILRRKI